MRYVPYNNNACFAWLVRHLHGVDFSNLHELLALSEQLKAPGVMMIKKALKNITQCNARLAQLCFVSLNSDWLSIQFASMNQQWVPYRDHM